MPVGRDWRGARRKRRRRRGAGGFFKLKARPDVWQLYEFFKPNNSLTPQQRFLSWLSLNLFSSTCWYILQCNLIWAQFSRMHEDFVLWLKSVAWGKPPNTHLIYSASSLKCTFYWPMSLIWSVGVWKSWWCGISRGAKDNVQYAPCTATWHHVSLDLPCLNVDIPFLQVYF